jgi:hypothetical protein
VVVRRKAGKRRFGLTDRCASRSWRFQGVRSGLAWKRPRICASCGKSCRRRHGGLSEAASRRRDLPFAVLPLLCQVLHANPLRLFTLPGRPEAGASDASPASVPSSAAAPCAKRLGRLIRRLPSARTRRRRLSASPKPKQTSGENAPQQEPALKDVFIEARFDIAFSTRRLPASGTSGMHRSNSLGTPSVTGAGAEPLKAQEMKSGIPMSR